MGVIDCEAYCDDIERGENRRFWRKQRSAVQFRHNVIVRIVRERDFHRRKKLQNGQRAEPDAGFHETDEERTGGFVILENLHEQQHVRNDHQQVILQIERGRRAIQAVQIAHRADAHGDHPKRQSPSLE